MDQIILTLKPGVTLAERGGQIGLVLQGRICFTKDAQQAEILRALVLQSQSLETLMALLHRGNTPLENDHRISLAMAEFILEFGEYLET
ncbi:hypothetical protein [Oscillibacter sp.]|uniref:hypothetical protein n=1 Tax=Oscillibacter sp. TaxID=1945593 RepID=UPI003396C8EB